jgi:two-component system sensor histidine kinase CiaH
MIDHKKNNRIRLNNNHKKKGSNIFVKARWKLTIFYTLFISFLVILFSFIIYFGYLYYLRGDFENELAGEEHGSKIELNDSENQGTTSQFSLTPQEISANASRRLGNIILIADGFIIAVSAFLGYALAGFTLKPIQNNQDVQRRFMSDASHELRTPLSIMKTGIEVELRNPANPLECKPILSSNLEEINRMADLVENLLFILRADSGSEGFKFETLDLSQIISTVFQNMKSYALQKEVALIQDKQTIADTVAETTKGPKAETAKDTEEAKYTEAAKDTEEAKYTEAARKSAGIFITGDLNKLKQAFYNILKNAVDYSKPGGQVQLTVIRQPKTVQIEITDKGTGIPDEELPFVFERFYRSSNNSGQYNNGSGLGLAITKEIIEKHKGEIKIESSFGNWTKVTISLPY